MDARQLWTGELGVRRFLVLVAGLPPTSALRAELGGYDRDTGPWTDERELLAQLLEVVSVGATEKHVLAKPVKVTRPSYLTPASAGTNVPDAMAPGDAARAMMAGRHLRVVG